MKVKVKKVKTTRNNNSIIIRIINIFQEIVIINNN